MQIDFMQYQRRAQDAMHEVVRESLAMIAEDGLMGDHHVYIVFDTRFPGVELSRKLREQFPAEMSVILQHQFAYLTVDRNQLSVVLSFGGVNEKLVVPFNAITAFHDPSVNFSVKFEAAANANRRRGPAGETNALETLHCDFCGAPGDNARKLAFGRDVCVCNECVNRIAEEFRSEATGE
jgi:hypothetical protein